MRVERARNGDALRSSARRSDRVHSGLHSSRPLGDVQVMRLVHDTEDNPVAFCVPLGDVAPEIRKLGSACAATSHTHIFVARAVLSNNRAVPSGVIMNVYHDIRACFERRLNEDVVGSKKGFIEGD
jgi:hypothetical protein